MMRVKDFCDIRLGHAFRERLENVPDGKMMVIQPKNISSEGLVSFGSGDPLRTDAAVTRPLERGDVLVVNRGRFAATVFDPPREATWTVPSSILVLSIKDATVLPEYLALYFNSVDGQLLFERHYEQTTVPFVSTRNLANMEVPIPPLRKQRALIAFEKTSREFARLANRKQELHRKILNYELMVTEQSTKRRTR